VPDSIKILAEQIDDQVEASTERCIAASESLIESTDLIALSRESIQRSRAQIRRINSMMPDSVELRKRAEWYREFAERAGTPWVWEARLKTAKRLEAEAVRVELEQERDNLPSPKG
jgi:hypothetical protein